MGKLFIIFISSIFIASCVQKTEEFDNETVTEDNKSTTYSSDTTKLSKLIDITKYRPIDAKFKYVFIDNSGQNQRLSIPGPSDSRLEAVLYFDSTELDQIKTKYNNADYPSPRLSYKDFNFEWLDAETINELKKTDTAYHGHPDVIFNLGTKGKLWFLKNKILLTKSSM